MAWSLACAATISRWTPARTSFASARVRPKSAMSTRPLGRLISTTSAHDPSPSAPISTSLKTQATHPPSVREQARIYPTTVAPPISRRSLKQVAGVLSHEDPARGAKAMILTAVERLRWRIWNGKAKDAQISIDRIHALLPSFESEPARKRRRALDAVDRYLRSQSAPLGDYAERHRAGLRVGTSLTEGTANFLVNRRMAKAQQMRWTRRGADRLLQVRCAVYNGTLGTGFGQRFYAANDALPPVAAAA